jgi:hypothetical protein
MPAGGLGRCRPVGPPQSSSPIRQAPGPHRDSHLPDANPPAPRVRCAADPAPARKARYGGTGRRMVIDAGPYPCPVGAAPRPFSGGAGPDLRPSLGSRDRASAIVASDLIGLESTLILGVRSGRIQPGVAGPGQPVSYW